MGPRTQGSGLVPRDIGIHLEAPAVDAAGHALALCYALFAQPIHYLKTAHAVVAIHDHGGTVRETFDVLELRRHGSHGDQLGTGDTRELEFAGLANVEQRDFFASIAAVPDVVRSNFKRDLCHANMVAPGCDSIVALCPLNARALSHSLSCSPSTF